MKKNLAFLLAIATTFLFTTTTFAAEESTDSVARYIGENIYLEHSSPDFGKIENVDRSILDSFDIALIPDSIIPLYYADLKDIAASGEITPKKYEIDSLPVFVAKVQDQDGNFAGEIQFCIDSSQLMLHVYTPMADEAFAMDIRENADIIAENLRNNDVDEVKNNVKLVWLDGAGYGILTENLDGQFFTSIGLQQKDSPLESAKQVSQGMSAIETLDTISISELAEIAKAVEPISGMMVGSDGNPMTGGGPSTIEDVSTNQSSSFVIGAIILSLGVVLLGIIKQRVSKNNPT